MQIFKILKRALVAAACVAAVSACDTIEPESNFGNAGAPITAEALKEGLSFTQLPNDASKVEGDQYIYVVNANPQVGGCWHLAKDGKDVGTYGFDQGLIIAPDNGDYQLYYVGISAHQVVRTEPFDLTVTNVFDEWMGLLSGAADKSDKGASKKWVFRGVKQGGQFLIAGAGGHGVWNDVGPEAWNTFVWWDFRYIDEKDDYNMVFYHDGSRFTSSDAEGNVKYEGKFSFSHTPHEGALIGDLTTTVPVCGGHWDYVGQKEGADNVFWIWELTDKVLTIYHPEKYSGGAAWDDCGWYAYYEAAE